MSLPVHYMGMVGIQGFRVFRVDGEQIADLKSVYAFFWGRFDVGAHRLAEAMLWDRLGREPHKDMVLALQERCTSLLPREWQVDFQELDCWIERFQATWPWPVPLTDCCRRREIGRER